MTDPPTQYGLGRRVQYDDRSRAFPVRALLHADLPLVTKRWYLPSTEPVLDQGATGSCVGHGITNDLRYSPRPVPRLDSKFAVEQIYWPAQRIDPWDGGAWPGAEPFYEGTSVLAGMQVAKALGWYAEFRWAFSEADLALAVSHIGPAVIGVPWYAPGMFKPDDDNTLHITGEPAGGHCVLIVGINLRRNAFMIQNSWGSSWGSSLGRAWITRPDMARLLREDGEAAIPTLRTRPPRQ
jgi:hypothetical protein